MEDVVKKARLFATQAHKRIDHRRKYTKQPYEVHLKAVAELVASVIADDSEVIAAAWLHDTVEDTPATFQDIEKKFGPGVAQLVSEVTDVSKASDGNRAVRKAIDCAHLAQASPRAKTIKLADLIDNCRDICRNDPGFARVYVTEMAALMEVLTEGNETLYQRAMKVLTDSTNKLGVSLPSILPSVWSEAPLTHETPFSRDHVQHLFIKAFTAKDIAQPLRSFDGERQAIEVLQKMTELDLGVVGVRNEGVICGYVLRADLEAGKCDENMRQFRKGQVLDGDASLSDVIRVLTRHDHCFVSLLGSVAGVVTRADIQKPIVRMWLFGMITLTEMDLVERIRAHWPNNSWTTLVPKARLQKAEHLLNERRRREQNCDLLDCLQLSDKAGILIEDPDQLAEFGFDSKRAAKHVIKELESLRNNLAHAQDIVTHDWPQIARMTHRLEDSIGKR